MKRFILGAAVGAAMGLSAPAYAAKPTPAPKPAPTLESVNPAFACHGTDVSLAADKCVGYYKGNLNGVPLSDPLVQKALELLDPGYIGHPYSVVEVLGKLSGSSIDFTGILSGKTIIGIHRGGAGDFKQDGTAFYLWNSLSPSDKITYNLKGLSNATLYTTTFSSVPEPATWMLMIAGIGLVGFALRRQKQQVNAKLNFA